MFDLNLTVSKISMFYSLFQLSMLADFSEIQCIKVAKDKDNMHRVELSVKGDEPGVGQIYLQLPPFLQAFVDFYMHPPQTYFSDLYFSAESDIKFPSMY
jgi:hypothetical protein